MVFQENQCPFKIPLATLSCHVLREPRSFRGHPPALCPDEEYYLVQLITTLQEWGQLSACSDVLKYASAYVKLMNLEHRFDGKDPGKDW